MFPQAHKSMVQLELKILVNLVFFAFVNAAFSGFIVFTRVPPRMQMPENKRSQLVTKWRNDLPRILKAQLAFWSVVQNVNFGLLPANIHVAVNSCALVLWTAYTSAVAYREVVKG